MKTKYDGKDGKVVFLEVEEITFNHPQGTYHVEASIYPIHGGKYSSFIRTQEPLSKIEENLELIANELLNDKKNSYGSKEISDILSNYLHPFFPQK